MLHGVVYDGCLCFENLGCGVFGGVRVLDLFVLFSVSSTEIFIIFTHWYMGIIRFWICMKYDLDNFWWVLAMWILLSTREAETKEIENNHVNGIKGCFSCERFLDFMNSIYRFIWVMILLWNGGSQFSVRVQALARKCNSIRQRGTSLFARTRCISNICFLSYPKKKGDLAQKLEISCSSANYYKR